MSEGLGPDKIEEKPPATQSLLGGLLWQEAETPILQEQVKPLAEPQVALEQELDLKNLDPATRKVRSLPGNYYMLREAAVELGVGKSMLRRFIAGDDPSLKPGYIVNMGQIKIYLYTVDDIARIREYLASQSLPRQFNGKPVRGRPSKWTQDDRVARQRLYSKRHYYLNKSSLGKTEEVRQHALDMVHAIEKELAEYESQP